MAMTDVQVKLIIALIGACIQYGPGLVNSAIIALGKDVITEEDILNLKITKEPEDF